MIRVSSRVMRVLVNTVKSMIEVRYHPNKYLPSGSKPLPWKSVKAKRVCAARVTMHSLKISSLHCFGSSIGL